MENSLAFTIPVEKLAELVAAYLKPEIQKMIREMTRGPDQDDTPKLLTRKEACIILRTSLPTLDAISRPPFPKLNKYRVGRSVRYRKDEVLAYLYKINNDKKK